MSKFMYGVEYLREFDANDDDHVQRKHRLFELPSGPKLLPDAFDCILARVSCSSLRNPGMCVRWANFMGITLGRESKGVYCVQSQILH